MTETKRNRAYNFSRFLWRVLVPGILVAAGFLLWFDKSHANDSSSFVTHLVNGGFFLGLAGNLICAFVILVFVDQVSRFFDEKDEAKRAARWKPVRGKLDARVRSFASGGMSSIRASLGFNPPESFYLKLAGDDTTQTQIAITRKVAQLLRHRLEKGLDSLGRSRWKDLDGAIRNVANGVRPLLEYSNWLSPVQADLLFDLEDQSRQINNLYIVNPEWFGQSGEIPEYAAEGDGLSVRMDWYRRINGYLLLVVDLLDQLVGTEIEDFGA